MLKWLTINGYGRQKEVAHELAYIPVALRNLCLDLFVRFNGPLVDCDPRRWCPWITDLVIVVANNILLKPIQCEIYVALKQYATFLLKWAGTSCVLKLYFCGEKSKRIPGKISGSRKMLYVNSFKRLMRIYNCSPKVLCTSYSHKHKMLVGELQIPLKMHKIRFGNNDWHNGRSN